MIEVGTTIHLEPKRAVDQDEQLSNNFKSRIVDIEQGKLIIDHPMNEKTGKLGFFYEGFQFNAWFIGKDQAIYSFETAIQGRKRGNIPMFILDDPGVNTYIRTQRRNFVRVETSTDIAMHPKDIPFVPFTSVTADLSGGGAAIIIPNGRLLPQGGLVQFWIALNMQSGETHYVKAICKVIRIFSPSPDAKKRASLEFIDINEQDRQSIIRYCFEKQLQLKRNEQ